MLKVLNQRAVVTTVEELATLTQVGAAAPSTPQSQMTPGMPASSVPQGSCGSNTELAVGLATVMPQDPRNDDDDDDDDMTDFSEDEDGKVAREANGDKHVQTRVSKRTNESESMGVAKQMGKQH